MIIGLRYLQPRGKKKNTSIMSPMYAWPYQEQHEGHLGAWCSREKELGLAAASIGFCSCCVVLPGGLSVSAAPVSLMLITLLAFESHLTLLSPEQDGRSSWRSCVTQLGGERMPCTKATGCSPVGGCASWRQIKRFYGVNETLVIECAAFRLTS